MHKASTQVIAVVVSVSFLFYPVTPVAAQAPQAGQVTARIPQAEIARPGQVVVANTGIPVLWDDLVETKPGGRVRITLQDGGILNVGSESSLRVVKHDATAGETSLVLTYGRMRVRTQKVGAGQHFEIRTNTAVLGVIGCDVYVFSGPNQTIVIVYEGIVMVTNINAAILGSQQLFAGQQGVVNAGQPPSPPSNYTGPQMEESVKETEVGENLPQPPGPKPPPGGGGPPAWVWVAALVGATAIAVAVPLATDPSNPQPTPVPLPRSRRVRGK